MPRHNNLSHLKKLVSLLKNKRFIEDCHAYYEGRQGYAGSGQQAEWDRQRPKFIADIHEPFVKKWGALPLSVVLLTSAAHYRRHYSITTGQWGIVPVYSWTSQADVEKQVQKIHAAIGKRGKEFVNDRNIHIADWLSQQPMPTGTRPQIDDVAAVVWNQPRQKSSRVSAIEEEAIFRREQALMKKYTSEGKTRSEAERLIKAALRRAESPASEKTRKALARLKQDRTNVESFNRDRRKTTPLGFALTRLISELPPLSPSPDPQRVLARALFLARLLNSI